MTSFCSGGRNRTTICLIRFFIVSINTPWFESARPNALLGRPVTQDPSGVHEVDGVEALGEPVVHASQTLPRGLLVVTTRKDSNQARGRSQLEQLRRLSLCHFDRAHVRPGDHRSRLTELAEHVAVQAVDLCFPEFWSRLVEMFVRFTHGC